MFETHLQTDIFTDRALEDETCGFSEKTKITCFSPYFGVLASEESVIGTTLPGKCQSGKHQRELVPYFWGPDWVDGE